MTSPGGLGEAFVSITADTSQFDEELASQLRKIAKERGPDFGEQLAKGTLTGFRRQIRADLPKYEALGKQLGTAVRRGFDGAKVGDRMAQDVLRGMRARLRTAVVRGPKVVAGDVTGGTGGASGGGGRTPLVTDGERAQDRLRKILQKRLRELAAEQRKADAEAERAAKAAERDRKKREADLIRDVKRGLAEAERAQKAAVRETERVERESLERRLRRNRAFQTLSSKLTPSFGVDDSLRAFTALGPGGGFGVRGLAAVGAAAAAATPQIASLFQALRNASGALLGIFPVLTTAGGLFALLGGENVRLKAALDPVADALDRVRLNLDGIAAAAAQDELRAFADEVERLQPGLEEFAERFGNTLGNLANNLEAAGAGASIGRALSSIGQAFETLTAGPGLTGFFRLILRINEEVSAALIPTFARLQVFLNGLETRFAAVDFGEKFLVGIQAVVDFGASVINLLRVLNSFFAAVSGDRAQGTFFSTLRLQLANLNLFIQANAPAITAFFDRVRAVVSLVGSAALLAFRVARTAIESFFRTVQENGPSLDSLRAVIEQLGPPLLTAAAAIGEFVGFLVAGIGQLIVFLQTNELLLPLLGLLAAAFAGIQLGLFIAGLASTIGAIAALGAPVLVAIAVFAALAAAVIYANESNSAFAQVLRTVLNTAFQVALIPLNLFLDSIERLIRAVQIAASVLSRFPGGEIFDGIVVGAQGAINAINAVQRAAASAVTIEGPGAGPTESDRRRDEALARRDPNRKRVKSPEEQVADAIAKIKIPKIRPIRGTSTGPRSTGGGGGAGRAPRAAAAPRNVDIEALIERITDALQDSLLRGAEATQEAFDSLRRSIRDTLKGTAQQGRTPAALAALERMRKSALAAAASYEQISKAVDATKTKLEDLRGEQESFRESVRDTLRDAASISTFLSNRGSGSATSFGGFLNRQIKALERFSDSLTTLLAKGLDPALVRDLAAGGLPNERFARRLAGADSGQLAELNRLQARINELSGGIADTTAATFDAGIKRVEALLNAQLIQQKKQEAQLNKLAEQIARSVAAAVQGKPLPKFAKGGITRGPSLAGEAGRELIVPLDRPNRKANALLERTLGGTTNAKYVTAGFTINAAPGQNPVSIAREVDRRLASTVR